VLKKKIPSRQLRGETDVFCGEIDSFGGLRGRLASEKGFFAASPSLASAEKGKIVSSSNFCKFESSIKTGDLSTKGTKGTKFF